MAGPRLREGLEPVERAAGRLQRGRGDMEVAGGGAEAAVPEQDLDGPEVGAGLEQVGGEAVPQGVHSDVLAQARGLPARRRQTIWTVRGLTGRSGSRPGKRYGPGRAAFQYSRRTARSRGESITSRSLWPLPWRTWMTMPPAVDVLDAEPGDLGEPQAAGVGGHEHGAVLGVLRAPRRTGRSRRG